MNYSEPLSNQLSVFLTGIGFGFIMCAFYVALKVLFRLFGKGKASVMISDAVFVLAGSIISFFFMIITNSGTVRFNLVVAQLFGGLVIYFTVGRYILRLLYPICDIVHLIVKNILYPVRVYFKSFFNAAQLLFFKLINLRNKKKDKKVSNKKKKLKIIEKSS